MNEQNINDILAGLKKNILLVILGVILIITIMSFSKIIENVPADKIIVNQVPISGTLEYWSEPGWEFQKFGETTIYEKAFQIWFSSKADQGLKTDESIKIIFNDAGIARISGSVRLVMPRDAKSLRLIHTEFGSMVNLVHELIRPTITKVVFSSGPLMSSFESYAVKKNDLIRYIEDQLQNGIYKTLSKEVKKIDELTGKTKVITVAELIPEPTSPGGFARQEKAPLKKYGIAIRAISVEDIAYEDKIMQQISSQQKALMDVQTAIAEAKKAKQEAIKAEEEGKAEYQKAKWKQEKINAEEIAKAEKDRAVAKLAMEKAKYQKQADILAGQGIATKKKLIMQADGALKQKLEAYIQVQTIWAENFAKFQGNLVPQIMMGDSKGSGASSAKNFMDILMMNAAQDLKVKVNPGK